MRLNGIDIIASNTIYNLVVSCNRLNFREHLRDIKIVIHLLPFRGSYFMHNSTNIGNTSHNILLGRQSWILLQLFFIFSSSNLPAMFRLRFLRYFAFRCYKIYIFIFSSFMLWHPMFSYYVLTIARLYHFDFKRWLLGLK